MDKKEIRTLIRNRKRLSTSQQLAEFSFAVVVRLLADTHMKAARTILLYHSLPDEVDTHNLLDTLVLTGKHVVLPRVTGEGTMELRSYKGPMSLHKGAYGIMEPSGTLFTDYDAIDVAVIPGVAFDRHRMRLGHGKGYYDRLLPLLKKAWKIGIAFDFQIVDEIPSEPHDIPMDSVIAENMNII